MKNFNVFIHQQIIPEYRVPVFNKLLDKHQDYLVVYGQPERKSSLKNGIIPKDRNYIKVRNLFLYNKGGVFLTGLFRLLFKYRPKVLITQYNPGNLNILFYYILRSVLKFKLIGWYQGWNRARDFSINKTFYDRLRHTMLKKADGIILYSQDAKMVLSQYKDPEKIFVANNTLDTSSFEILRKQFEKEGKESLKDKLGFKTKFNIIYVSRLEAKKKPEELIRVFQLLSDESKDVTLHVVGAGTMENELQSYVKEEKIENIKFYGSIYDDVITGSMIYCSDLMIIPKWVGLSIVHSFSFECPLITFEEKYHPPEINYLINGKTGYILGHHSNNERAKVIWEYLKDSNLQIQFKKNILEIVKTEASVDKMIEGVSNAINYFIH